MRIKKGDSVLVLTGRSRGKTGKVLFVDMDKQTVLVEGLQMVKKHQKPTQTNRKGGIISKEAPIHLSNVSLYVQTDKGIKPTRVGYKLVDAGQGKSRKVRISRTTGEEI